MPLPRPASPRALWNDMRAFWRERPRHQWVAGTLAILIPAGILLAFYIDGQSRLLPREQVIYVNDWPATRTDAEIKAKQRVDQARREAALRERQRQFQEVDQALNRLGI